jgi:hypothetical protein
MIMNLRKLAMGAAIAASVVGGSVAATAPVQAATLTPPGDFVISGKTKATSLSATQFKLDFTGLSIISSSGGLTGLTGTAISSLTLNKLGGTTIGPIAGFISGLSLGGDAVSFDLTGGNFTSTFNSATKYTVGSSFFGNLVSSNSIAAVGSIAVTRLNDSNFAFVPVSAEAVPTPALLPALLGMGAAALRKRKDEEAKVEAVDVKA